MTEQAAHALLGASSAHRWLHCTPCVRLEETLPEVPSVYAEEGTLAHSICELKVRKAFIEPMGPRSFASKLKKLQEHPLYKDEMLRHTDTYLDYISRVVHLFPAPPYIAIEKKLNYAVYAPEGFGTGDCIILGGTTMYVIDFKYGQGVPVSAFENPQLKLYALGAYLAYSLIYGIKQIILVVVQPRLDNISTFELTVDALLAWGDSIKPTALMAWNGEGHFESGEHCKFCRANSLCRARAEFNISLEDTYPALPPLLTNEEVGAILLRAQNLAAWASSLESYALSECVKGGEIPGWKAVAGRGSRHYVNQDEAFKALTAGGIAEVMLYERKPLTVAAVEDVLGKLQYKTLLVDAGHISKEPGKPTLVPESDKREPIKQMTAEEAFGGINTIESGGIEE